ncbi:MAG: hypothetical protein ABT02_09955 [Comamonadaceae bacterium SCN 68-20]|nr:MAG: hypothetical protein ABT02_09955 [Comamonadaceae bacterium SCN 68-20]OJX10971.1 MAG: hypothetical protein BGO75_12155 [Burkholderiales bacterium 68-20]
MREREVTVVNSRLAVFRVRVIETPTQPGEQIQYVVRMSMRRTARAELVQFHAAAHSRISFLKTYQPASPKPQFG